MPSLAGLQLAHTQDVSQGGDCPRQANACSALTAAHEPTCGQGRDQAARHTLLGGQLSLQRPSIRRQSTPSSAASLHLPL